MNTIVIYASKHGAAENCVNLLKSRLRGNVKTINIMKESIPDIGEYDNVIIGGSIYAGKIQKEITEYTTKNINSLIHKRIGLFISCMSMENYEKQLVASFPKELYDVAVVKDSFGGGFNFKDMNFMEKMITKMVSKSMAKKDPKNSLVDTKKDISMISEEAISKFAMEMNK